MELKISEEYDALPAEWQYEMVRSLKRTLENHGIEKKMAKKIVGEFTFYFSVFHDQGEFEVDGKMYYPRICFEDDDGLFFSTGIEIDLHDYALGTTEHVYEEPN